MTRFDGLWIGLSLAFGCLVLALVGEVYYLLWRKKRIAVPSSPSKDTMVSPDRIHYAKELLHLLVHWKKPSPERQGPEGYHSGDRIHDSNEAGDPELGTAEKDAVARQNGEESVVSELMRLHNLAGPRRLLFTIKEETKEDLESNDGRSRKGSRARSLSDLILSISSAPLGDSYNNPLFELVWSPSSPPPTFKFLRDAEEKMYKRMQEETDAKLKEIQEKPTTVPPAVVDDDGSPAEHTQNKKKTAPAGSSQVLPLVSSPRSVRPAQEEKGTCL
ncbi:hypothetical protein SAY86_008322 [Trapa natans]|uniref:Uncharacterized protein n=1 Tax=Trapa natans TaxID=22666 RepID=A0AAN7KCP4_TRANT|nr:hypothetical protein SAY86_008322 [Trapa natans]